MITIENAPTTTVNTLQIEVNSAITQLFGQLIQAHKLFHHFTFTIDNPENEFPSEQLTRTSCVASNIEGLYNEGGSVEAIYAYKNGLVYFISGGNRIRFNGRFPNKQEMEEVRAEALNWAKTKPIVEDTVPVFFWNWGQHGPSGTVRNIRIVDWANIEQNYPSKTRKSIQTLIKSNYNDLSGSGKIILWHGDPGAGKTYAIRSLIHEWRNWCTVHYIIDPDEFFSRAEYMVSVMNSALQNTFLIKDYEFAVVDTPGPRGNGGPVIHLSNRTTESYTKSPENKSKWTLLIFEDSGELISTTAKHQTGQALSKLLNLGDGLIGQSLNLLILITTNEDHEHLHPAISREGRCLSNILFEKFNKANANKWLEAHDLPAAKLHSYVLSDLYAELTKHKTITNTAKSNPIGFVGNGKNVDSERSQEIES